MEELNLINELFKYDHNSGLFTHKIKRKNVKIDQIAGTITQYGYVSLNVYGKKYLAHRVAWAMIYNDWPKNDIDHINNIRSDNRLINLREATRSENIRNSLLTNRNKCGKKGVSYSKSVGKYVACIFIDKKHIHLGYYNDINQAYDVYCTKGKELFGEFFNNGKR